MENNRNIKEYHIEWCPICDQGWVDIVKDKMSSKLFLCCKECETEWINPDNIGQYNCLPFNTFQSYESPTISEIHNIGWDKFLKEK